MSEAAEPRRGGLHMAQARRVKMIFSVMASPNRIDILRILNSKGALAYSELKSMAGFKSKKESGKFAYHLRKLLRQSLVSLNKSERRYTITNLGQLVLSLARQIEERSVAEGGKMYVRTSRESVEEFSPHKITQSLTKEGGLPYELAQKMTEEAENRLYKYQPAYLTGALIRDIVNSVLLEHGHEEYRGRLARVGVPAYDIGEAMARMDGPGAAAAGLPASTGLDVLREYLLSSALPKDVADGHLNGGLHVASPGTWLLLPDTAFVGARGLLGGGGGPPGVDAAGPPRTPAEAASALSVALSLASREASREVVVDDLPSALARHARDPAELEPRLAEALAAASASAACGGAMVTLRLPGGSDQRASRAIVAAYKRYAAATPAPRIGLSLGHSRRPRDAARDAAEIAAAGGVVSVSRGSASAGGVPHPSPGEDGRPAVVLGSLSLNMPRLALKANRDEKYFRAQLVILLGPALQALSQRRKAVADLTRRGLHPVLSRATEHMREGHAALAVSLVGLREAATDILGLEGERAEAVMRKAVETASERAARVGGELGDDIRVCMTENAAAARFSAADAAAYGKNSALGSLGGRAYSEGAEIPAGDAGAAAAAARLAGMLNGGLSARLLLPPGAGAAESAAAIELAAAALPSVRAVRAAPA